MTEILKSGWWRCKCEKDCNCNKLEQRVKKMNPPELSLCAACRAINPAKAKFFKQMDTSRAEQREAKRLAVRNKNG